MNWWRFHGSPAKRRFGHGHVGLTLRLINMEVEAPVDSMTKWNMNILRIQSCLHFDMATDFSGRCMSHVGLSSFLTATLLYARHSAFLSLDLEHLGGWCDHADRSAARFAMLFAAESQVESSQRLYFQALQV